MAFRSTISRTWRRVRRALLAPLIARYWATMASRWISSASRRHRKWCEQGEGAAGSDARTSNLIDEQQTVKRSVRDSSCHRKEKLGLPKPTPLYSPDHRRILNDATSQDTSMIVHNWNWRNNFRFTPGRMISGRRYYTPRNWRRRCDEDLRA